jgi:hypothetical protein
VLELRQITIIVAVESVIWRTEVGSAILRFEGYTMPKRYFWIAALALAAAGLFVGVMLLPASWVTTAQWEPQSCWHPGLERNIGIAEQACE